MTLSTTPSSKASTNSPPPAELSHLVFPADLLGPMGLPRCFESAQEVAYSQQFNHQWRPIRRYSSWCVMALWSLFFISDLSLARDSASYDAVLWRSWTVRAVVLSVVVVAHVMFFRVARIANAPGLASNFLITVASWLAVGMAAWIVLMPYPYNQLHGLSGMTLVIIGAYVLFGISTRAALKLALVHLLIVVGLVVFCGQQANAQHEQLEMRQYHVKSAIFMVTAVIMGCLACWLIELSFRNAFRNQQILESLNTELSLAREAAVDRLANVMQLQAQLQHETEQREKAQAQFLASAVHDLRQPVQALSTLLVPVGRAIELGQRDEARHMLQLSQQATHTLQQLLGTILEVSRLESGTIQPVLVPVNLKEVLRDLCTTWAAQAEQAGVRFVVRQPPRPCWVRSDAGFLQRILGNLISNALKYQDPHRVQHRTAEVDILLASTAPTGLNSALTLTVRDNGIGMDQAWIDRGTVFQPFVQLDTVHAQADKGVGLGLAIVTKLLALLPGHALVMHSSPGHGTEVRVVLPEPLPEPAQPTLLVAGPTGLPSLAGAYLWLVEDDALVRASLTHFFESLHARVDTFADLPSVIVALETLERPPDVVISDYRLPAGASAEDVRQHILEGWGEIPMLVLSGEQRDLSQLPALAGCPCLVKPVDTGALLRCLVRLMQTG